MLRSVTILKDVRGCLKKGETFTFRPGLNLLVGDQGTGKTSLLSLIRSAAIQARNPTLKGSRCLDLGSSSKVRWWIPEASEVVSLDWDISEFVGWFPYDQDPRGDNGALEGDDDNFLPSQAGDRLGVAMSSTRVSHGQLTVHVLFKLLRAETTPPLLLLDEPDNGFSPTSQMFMTTRIEQFCERHGNQIILITHGIPLIQETDEVLDLTAGVRGWAKSSEHLRRCREYVDSHLAGKGKT